MLPAVLCLPGLPCTAEPLPIVLGAVVEDVPYLGNGGFADLEVGIVRVDSGANWPPWRWVGATAAEPMAPTRLLKALVRVGLVLRLGRR